MKISIKDINNILNYKCIARHWFWQDSLYTKQNQPRLIQKDDYMKLQKITGGFKKSYNEILEEYKKKKFTFNLPTGVTDVWEFIPDKVRYGHKTQKPKDITDRIIRASSNEGDLVYIPFAGSGSEIVSCINNNRNYIATETNKDYIENIIYQRLENIG